MGTNNNEPQPATGLNPVVDNHQRLINQLKEENMSLRRALHAALEGVKVGYVERLQTIMIYEEPLVIIADPNGQPDLLHFLKERQNGTLLPH